MNMVFNKRSIGLLTCVLGCLIGGVGCMSVPRLPVQGERYRIEVQLDPVTHKLVGRTTIDLTLTGEAPTELEPVRVDLLLHPDMKVTQITAGGAKIRRHRRGRLAKELGGNGFAPRVHTVVLEEPVEALTLFVDYEGELFQDVAAGESAGQIHNFSMRAHIGEDGIYLGGGYWYPSPRSGADEVDILADFTLETQQVDGMVLEAGGERDTSISGENGKIVWRSPYPIEGMVLVGGPHVVHRGKHGDVDIQIHLKPSQAEHAEPLLEAVKGYLDRYEPLIGPYPAKEFRIVDNFFSSGFAFPTFTLLSSAVINMGERARTGHGYIDHEMLHCWWGNGVHVDPEDGNWCEALASYGANYYGYILDGNEEGARNFRRNQCNFLSRIKPENDKPLGTFSRPDGVGRGIGYFKGAMVFHMLARRIGQENFWKAMRQLTADFTGRYASWDDFRTLFEEAGGVDLESFFDQWVRGSGAPQLGVDYAKYNSAEGTLLLGLSQGETEFDLNVPVRVVHASGTLNLMAPLSTSKNEVALKVNVVPISVELDPDYHIFRRISDDDIMPTTAKTRSGTAFASIIPTGEVFDDITTIRDSFEKSFEDDERVRLTVGEVSPDELSERCVLILGDAVRDDGVRTFLESINFPVTWTDNGFVFDGITYDDPSDGLLCTVRQPNVTGGGVTVVYGNTKESFPRASTLGFYANSLIVFKDKKPNVRADFEPKAVVPVEPM